MQLLNLLLPTLCTCSLSGPYFFDQLSAHLSPLPSEINQTFEQRYWIESSHYLHGGPIFLVDAADKPGEVALRLVETGGVVHQLTKATNGAAIVLEQRYYGRSLVSPDLSVEHLQLLNTDEALADIAYFAHNFPYDNPAHGAGVHFDSSVLPTNTPWISYGFWIAGAKGAWMRAQHPDVFWGTIASSPALFAIENVWQYLEAIRLGADPTCVRVITTVVDEIDTEIEQAGLDASGEITVTERLDRWMHMFHLSTEPTVRDFMNQVATPLGLWQRKSWDVTQQDYASWDYFCGNLTQHLPVSPGELELRGLDDGASFVSAAVRNYAHYIQYYRAIGHQSLGNALLGQGGGWDRLVVPLGEIRRNRTEAQKHDLSQTWRLWYWQACTEVSKTRL